MGDELLLIREVIIPEIAYRDDVRGTLHGMFLLRL